MESRKEIAEKIAQSASDYKICEGCSSIIVVSTTICPNCHAYRFNTSEQDVITQARLLGARAQQSVTAEDLTD